MITKNSLQIDDASISKNRNFLMGVAILFIMLCHNSINVGRFSTIWAAIYSLGQCGVDIFLLLSGFGLYYSYSKYSSYLIFIKKRFSVIIPAYLFVCVPYAIITCLIGSTTIKQAVWDYSLISFFISGTLDQWYIASILVLYILFPLFFYIAKNNKFCCVTCIILWSLSITIRNIIDNPTITIIAGTFINRIPVFILGIKLAEIEKKEGTTKESLLKHIIIATILVIGALYLQYIMNGKGFWTYLRIIFCPLSISTCYILIYLRTKLNKYIDLIICYLGKLTLYIYLLHEKVLSLLNIIFKSIIYNPYICSVFVNIFAVLVTIGISILLSKLLNSLKCKPMPSSK